MDPRYGSDIVHEERPKSVDKVRQQRIKSGECPTCQRRTHKVSRFRNKREPLTVEGEVLNGICLSCNPLTQTKGKSPSNTDPSKGAAAAAVTVAVPDTFVCDDDFTVASEITLDTCIEQQIPKRINRYSSKQFESVSEETPMTNFGKHEDNVPINIIGSQRGRRDRERGPPPMARMAEDDDEDDDKKWIATQRRQRFHPMSREMYLFNSERSLGIESNDGSETSSEYFRPPKLHPLSRELYKANSERSLTLVKQQSDRSLSLDEVLQKKSPDKESDGGGNKRSSVMNRESSTNSLSAVSSESGYSSDGQRKRLQQSSPSFAGESDLSLSLDEVLQKKPPTTKNKRGDDRRAQLKNREASMTSLGAMSSESGYSSDGQRIKSLLQGSTSLLKKGGDSDRSLSLDEVIPKKPTKAKNERADDRRAQFKNREASMTSLGAMSTESGYSSDGQRIKSLLQGSATLTKGWAPQSRNDQDVDRDGLQKEDVFIPAAVKPPVKQRPSRFSIRAVSRSTEPNRFSLNLQDLSRRSSDPGIDFEMEMRNSRNWNSVDILRECAAEANGEKLDMKVFAKEMEAELRAKNSAEKPISHAGIEKTELEDIINAMHSFSSSESSNVASFKAACATLARLALNTRNHTKMDELGVVQILCDALSMHSSSEKVTLVCCTALANLSVSPEIRETIATHGGINALFESIKAKSGIEIDREAFRALSNLSDASSKVKQIISCELDTIIGTFYRHKSDNDIHSTTCSILRQLSEDSVIRAVMIAFPEIFDILATIIQRNPSQQSIEKHACSLLRNLSLEENAEPMVSFVPFMMMVIAEQGGSDEDLLENACKFLSSVGLKQPGSGFGCLCTDEGIKCIINALQTHNASTSLLRACCEALYAVINDSEEHRSLCISVGAVDAIICMIMIHPHNTMLLESAVGVLASLSSQRKSVSAIAFSGGIGSVAASMRANPSSGIIKNGSIFILNVVQADSAYANEAVPAVVPILSCIREHINDATLMEELCRFLHYLVLVSENWADRIISAGGIPVIEAVMKEHGSRIDITNECDILLQILNKIT